MNNGARIGLAVGAGYLLGRRRKLRKALVLAAAVAAGRASQNSGGLMNAGSRLLQSSPQLGNLGRLGGPLVAASKAAATAAAGSGIDAVGGKLRGSADALRRKGGAGQQNEGDAEQQNEGDAEQQNDGDAGRQNKDGAEQQNKDDQGSGDARPEGAGADKKQRGR
ncbi:hypothetical protein [Micromonospora sp. NPDC049799]|uniref:hypothetical protein n=1 Tax=Micromonospora sp. NPDC049799 TaxID=3154741 RepID=UPI0033ED655B